MEVKKLLEAGIEPAMFGLSLSYNTPVEKAYTVAEKLCNKDGGHNKVLEQIMLWFDINAPRYWWQQFDTYRIDVSRQSESTMHTILKKPLSNSNFARPLSVEHLKRLNEYIDNQMFDTLKNELPEGFLQRRVVKLSYMSLRRIIKQRYNHKLCEWKQFCIDSYNQVASPQYLGGDIKERIELLLIKELN